MLSNVAQTKLYQKFLNPSVQKAINENFSFDGFVEKIENKKCYSCVAYIDIYGFSNKIIDYSPEQVRDYLFGFYGKTLKHIKEYNGQIEKIMGDGIIIIFSNIFGEIKTEMDASNNCFFCCKNIIEELYDTEYESKAAIGSGQLFFCRTGIEQIYEEYSCIGHPLTIAYRLENLAESNQILQMGNTKLSARVKEWKNALESWNQYDKEVEMKGINSKKVHVTDYNDIMITINK